MVSAQRGVQPGPEPVEDVPLAPDGVGPIRGLPGVDGDAQLPSGKGGVAGAADPHPFDAAGELVFEDLARLQSRLPAQAHGPNPDAAAYLAGSQGDVQDEQERRRRAQTGSPYHETAHNRQPVHDPACPVPPIVLLAPRRPPGRERLEQILLRTRRLVP